MPNFVDELETTTFSKIIGILNCFWIKLVPLAYKKSRFLEFTFFIA